MLFLYRPRQTRMPWYSGRRGTEQYEYNRRIQAQFAGTHRVLPAVPVASATDAAATVRTLESLHQRGILTDAEFAAARARVQA